MGCTDRIRVHLADSLRPGKKYAATLGDGGGVVNFGAAGYEDYTMHKDVVRRDRYLQRHCAREVWSKSGLATPGFWSRWLLWNRATLAASKRDMARRFCLHFV